LEGFVIKYYLNDETATTFMASPNAAFFFLRRIARRKAGVVDLPYQEHSVTALVDQFETPQKIHGHL
jgi:hypothetical protein